MGRGRLDRSGDEPGTRRCTHCRASKSPSDFHTDRSRYDGLTTWCKICCNESNERSAKKNAVRRKATAKIWKANNSDKLKRYQRASRLKRRRELLARYGGSCACCGEDRLEFLAIDHINGGGTRHRTELAAKGDVFYKWLKREGYPPGFRVLCHNCNLAIGFYGKCPHEVERGTKRSSCKPVRRVPRTSERQLSLNVSSSG